MKTIFLIRHGEKVGEAGNPGLTELGHVQAKNAGQYFSQFPISQIITSPYMRTQQTAERINDILNVPIDFDDRLIERMNWDGETVTFPEFQKEWTKATNQRDYIPLWGYSSEETGKRVASVVSDLPDGQQFVLVTHGGAIVDYLRNQFGDEAVIKLSKQFSEGLDYEYQHCGISKITVDPHPDSKDVVNLEFVCR